MCESKSIKLPTGVQMPMIGLGTWLSKNEQELCTAVQAALDVGYRLFDTAYLYQTESGLGRALQQSMHKTKIEREDIFVTTKLPFTAHAPEDVEVVVNEQLEALQLDYIDLYLIHCPCAVQHKDGNFTPLILNEQFAVQNTDLLDTWRALEKLYKNETLRAIGLSNFNIAQIEYIFENAEIKPHNLQVEVHAYFRQHELHKFCQEHSITMTAYAPLGSPGRKQFNPNGYWPEAEPLKDATVMAIAKQCYKTPAQVLLRYLVQRGICVVPKSVNIAHIRENFKIFDFELTIEQMDRLNAITKSTRLFVFDYFAHHPSYPMLDQDRSKFGKVVFESF